MKFDPVFRHFRRLFSCNFRKTLTLPLAEMPFSTDFVRANRGDPCPLTEKTGAVSEEVTGGSWRISSASGTVSRLIGAYAPYATCEIRFSSLNGAVGFTFCREGRRLRILFESRDGHLVLRLENGGQTEEYPTALVPVPGARVLVTCRNEKFDCYYDCGNGYAETVRVLSASGWEDLRMQRVIRTVTVSCTVCGSAELSAVRMYMDCGVRQADIRTIRYEDGSPILEDGKLYLTMSVRQEEQCYTGVFSWVPGTMRFEMVGALFFDAGDGILAADVASSILYHRPSGKWYLWVCSFSHGHILAHAELQADPRWGVNVVDYQIMEPMREGDDDTVFRGKMQDEDPDFLYDAGTGTWYLTVCRMTQTEDGQKYRYHLFRSDSPFDGYRFVTRSENGNETGGSLILREDGLYFACGSSFDQRALYHVYRLPDMSTPAVPTFDYDDGGFRGWGTIIPVRRGTRETVYHLTFDRERGSDWNWSYGNLYCFVSDPG